MTKFLKTGLHIKKYGYLLAALAIGSLGGYWTFQQYCLGEMEIDIRASGADGNAMRDASPIFQQAMLLAKTKRHLKILVPPGRYLVGNLIIYSNTELFGEFGAILIQCPDAQYLLSINPARGGTADPAENMRNIKINNIAFDGGAVQEFREHSHLLNISAATDVCITSCRFISPRGDAIYCGSSNYPKTERHNENISITNCIFDGIDRHNRNGITIIDCRNAEISHCLFARLSAPGMPGPVDIEPDGNRFARIRNITINDNVFTQCGGGAGKISIAINDASDMDSVAQNIEVRHNVIASDQLSGSAILVRFANVTHAQAPVFRELNNILILNNYIGAGEVTLRGVAGFEIHGNYFNARRANACVVGDIDARRPVDCREGTILNNTFSDTGAGFAALTLGNCEDVRVEQNSFERISTDYNRKCAILIIGAAKFSKHIKIEKDIYSGPLDYKLYIDQR